MSDPVPFSAKSLLCGSRLCAAVVGAFFTLSSCGFAQAPEKTAIVLLLDPSHKGQAEKFKDALKKTPFSTIARRGADRDPFFLVQPAETRVEVGTAAKDVKDWRFLVQLGAAVPAPQPGFRGSAQVPYAIHFRSAPDAKAVEIIKSSLHLTSSNFEQARNDLHRGVVNNLMVSDMRRMVSLAILTGKPYLDRTDVFFPISYDKRKEGKSAVVNLHNRLPVAVEFSLLLTRNANAAAPGVSYQVPARNSGKFTRIILEPGQKQTLQVPAKDFTPNFAPSWVKIDEAYLIDNDLIPWKAK